MNTNDYPSNLEILNISDDCDIQKNVKSILYNIDNSYSYKEGEGFSQKCLKELLSRILETLNLFDNEKELKNLIIKELFDLPNEIQINMK